MEANKEKTPMIAMACELRGVDFQNSALGRLTGALCVRFKIVFPLHSEDTRSYFRRFNSGHEMRDSTASSALRVSTLESLMLSLPAGKRASRFGRRTTSVATLDRQRTPDFLFELCSKRMCARVNKQNSAHLERKPSALTSRPAGTRDRLVNPANSVCPLPS